LTPIPPIRVRVRIRIRIRVRIRIKIRVRVINWISFDTHTCVIAIICADPIRVRVRVRAYLRQLQNMCRSMRIEG